MSVSRQSVGGLHSAKAMLFLISVIIFLVLKSCLIFAVHPKADPQVLRVRDPHRALTMYGPEWEQRSPSELHLEETYWSEAVGLVADPSMKLVYPKTWSIASSARNVARSLTDDHRQPRAPRLRTTLGPANIG